MIGEIISHYRIVELLGEGGMGVVYKAHDIHLERVVALKFLANHLLGDSNARKRFLREAKAAASLNHPRICTIYEIGETDGRTFIAMAFVEGESLQKKIARSPLPIDEALRIARQLSEGLQAARRKDIVHRDIKPANIMVDDAGNVTIMDFGLARSPEHSVLTQAETTLGTVSYMSPEQAQGSQVDHRTDIWSLGVVLYEMVAGDLPFKGDYPQAQVYSILNEAPMPLTARRKDVPLRLDWVADKAMAKQAALRYQSATELAIDLEALQAQVAGGVGSAGQRTSISVPGAAAPVRKRPWIALLAAGLAVSLAVTVLMWMSWPRREPSAPMRLSINPGIDVAVAAISPNGGTVAYVAPEGKGSIWLRDLADETPRQLPQTSGARLPFWHPDSEYIAFAAGDELLRVSPSGAPPVLVCRLPGKIPTETGWRTGAYSGGAWSMDGKSIYLAVVGEGAYRVPAQGGTPVLLIENEHIEYLSSLPPRRGEELLLYASGTRKDSEMHEIVVHSLTTGARTVVATVEFPTPEPVYSATGHILYRAPGTGLSYLRAVPFSLDRLEVTGDSFVLARGAEDPRISRDGTLVYLTPRVSHHQLVWLDRGGRKLADVGEPHSLIWRQNWRTESIRFPTLSPDGRLAAVTLSSEAAPAIWIQEVERPVRTRLTLDSEEAVFATWSPSGNRVTFSSRRNGQWDILSRPADGSGDTESLVDSALDEGDPDWSNDGRNMLFVRVDPERGRDIWYLRKNAGGYEPKLFLQTPFNEGTPKFSHDGRFVAYTSDQSGRPEVYVRPFPEGTGRWQISIGGGGQPRWGSNDREILYVQDDTLISAQVTTRPAFSLGAQTHLFRSDGLRSADAPQYDVSPDGQRFLLAEPIGRSEQRFITVALNWFAGLPER